MRLQQTMLILIVLCFCLAFKKPEMAGELETTKDETSMFYTFKEKKIEGKLVDFSIYKGKACLVVNTACNCGLAKSNFETIREIKNKHPEIAILLFPSSVDLTIYMVEQEEAQKEETIQKMKENGVYDISTVFEKCKINGKDGSHLFAYLSKEAPGLFGTKAVKWNFTKFLVSKTGDKVTRFGPKEHYSDMKSALEESV